jgi:hypothetical protein
LTADGFSQDHMNRLVEKFDKRYLIVIDNLELAEDKIILVLESLKKLLFYKEDIYKPFIIVTSRTNFLDKLLLDLGIKPIRPLDLKKKMKPFLKMVVGEAEYNSRLANQGDFETLVEKISEKIGDLPGIIVIFIMLLQYKDMEIGDLFQILDTNMGGNEKFTERLIVKIFKTAFDRLEIHVQKIFLLLLVLGPDNVQEKTKITGLIGKRIPALADKAIEALEQLEKSCLIYTVNEPGNDKIGIKSTVFLHILFDEAFKSDLREKELPELWSYWDYWRLRKALRYDQPVNVIESLLYRDYPEKKEIKRLKYNLHMAIAARNCSYPKALDLLQQAGCGVNDIDVHIKLPPLFYALAFNHHKNVISILDWFHHNKKYRKRKEFNGVTALQIAVAFASNYDVLEWLKNNGYKTYKDTDVNLFNHAAKNNANAGFMEILCKKFDIHMRDSKGKRPLHHAAALNENPSVVKLLIDEETINSRDKDRMTPLHHAAFNPNYAVTKVLLAYNACIGAVDKDGDTPLHIAVACNTNVEVARALLDAGSYIYINTPNKDGYTPLYNALAFGNHEVYNLLNIWRRS